MSTPDCFLVAWWLLAAAVGISTFIAVRRSHARDREAAVLSYLQGIPPKRRPLWPSPEMPRPLQLAVLISSVPLVLGGLALLWMHDWTRLLMLNGQIFMVLIGLCIVMAGMSARTLAGPDWPRAITLFTQAGLVLLGILLVALGSITAINDIARPRRVVEGHVDRTGTSSRRSSSEYFVVIDGKRFRSTFEAFEHIQPNRRVRVEIGAGSGVILAADDNALQPVEQVGRN